MTIPVVLPPEWIARLNIVAAARHISRSALIREAIAHSLCEELERSTQEGVPDGQEEVM